jgi:hypothetical protein
MQTYRQREIQSDIKECLLDFPVVAILGPRQCGKSTLAHYIVKGHKNSVYIDLERPSDVRKLHDAELFFTMHKDSLICLDEIQRALDIFPVIRSIVDEHQMKGHFLILGSASRDLIQQSSESLAGRIAYLELTPFLFTEACPENEYSRELLFKFWLRGGFPESFLARNNDASVRWRENFIRTFLERDIPQMGFRIPAESIRRLWTMLAHNHGQLLNSSRLGESLGASHTTIRSYIDLLVQTFMIQALKPLIPNIKKRMIKSPKIYIRDSGILHTLLEADTMDKLICHPVYGSSWEGFVIESILSCLRGWKAAFYRTSSGTEIDLVIEKGKHRFAIECKASSAPKVSKGFSMALQELEIDEAWIISPVEEAYPVAKNITVSPLKHFLKTFRRSPYL